MNIQKLSIARMFTVSSIVVIAVLLLSACGAFSFQGQAVPNKDGGITVSGGSQPQTAAQPASGIFMNQTTILIIVGVVILVVIILMLIMRGGSSKNNSSS
jgi:hypothetical protein